jgi:Bucentaur or craniofacial development
MAKRPGRRKPKVQLAELPSSADLHKGKKLTTLEKSALDWKAHVTASGERELAAELEANRRGGGYLEKVEFLHRVGDRKNQSLEANKDQKRRRG